jgi:hypothetical protein
VFDLELPVETDVAALGAIKELTVVNELRFRENVLEKYSSPQPIWE